VEEVQDKPLYRRLIVDLLWRQPLSLQQRVDRLVVLPPLGIPMGNIEEMVGAALDAWQAA